MAEPDDGVPLCSTTPLVRHEDVRGALVKIWPAPVAGEVYAVELRPGHSRGHHLHRRGAEVFVALVGQAELVVEDPVSGRRERHLLHPGGARVRVAAGLAHALWAVDAAGAWVVAMAENEHQNELTEAFPVASW